jgi:hypothetical protein
MSLLDLILEQKIIVISVVIAIIPLLIAAGYMVQKSIRQMLSQRKQRQAAQHTRQMAVAVAGSVTQSDLLEELQPAEAQTSQQEAAQATANPTAAVVVQPAAGQPEQEKPGQEQAANQIQSLLTSVFADDGSEERNEVLLRGTQPIDIRDLALFCQSVAGRLRASGE